MAPRTHLYVGCYTSDSPIGIAVYDWSDPARSPIELSTLEGIEHPSFLAAHPNGTVLYAVNETAPPDSGSVTALRVDPVDGSLETIDRVPSHGGAPCHLSVDPEGRHLYVANYLSGTVAAYRLEPDGRFGDLIAIDQHHGSGPSSRQDGPHAHCIVPGPIGGHCLLPNAELLQSWVADLILQKNREYDASNSRPGDVRDEPV